LNKLRLGDNLVEGTRQNNPVTSEQRVLEQQVAQKWGWRLFIKNTGRCKIYDI